MLMHQIKIKYSIIDKYRDCGPFINFQFFRKRTRALFAEKMSNFILILIFLGVLLLKINLPLPKRVFEYKS